MHSGPQARSHLPRSTWDGAKGSLESSYQIHGITWQTDPERTFFNEEVAEIKKKKKIQPKQVISDPDLE